MIRKLLVLSALFTIGPRVFGADFTVTFHAWYTIKAKANGVPTTYTNNGNTTLPEWLTIYQVGTDKARVFVTAACELNDVGLIRNAYSATGLLKWRVDATGNPSFSLLEVTWDARGDSIASATANATEGLAQARAVEDNTGSTTILVSRTHGSDYDTEKVKQSFSRVFSPAWASSGPGAHFCYVHQDFYILKGYSVVKIVQPEEMLGASPENMSPTTAAFAKPWVEFVPTEVTDTPTFEEAGSVDDGVIRIYGTSVGTKEEPVDMQLFTQNNILIRALRVYAEADSRIYVSSKSTWPAGTYQLFLKPKNGLRKRTLVNFNGSSPITATISYLWGDVDGDNEVTIADLNNIQAYMGLSSNDPGYDEFKDEFKMTGEACDLNRDNRVDSTDMSMAQQNLGIVGD